VSQYLKLPAIETTFFGGSRR